MPAVTFLDGSRTGRVTYVDGRSTITGYVELGGNDVVAILSMGSAKEWCKHHGWALERRSMILRVVADEAIRQRSPGCVAEIDETSGDILLRAVNPR